MKSSMKHELARRTTAMQQEAHATGIITDTSDLFDSNNDDDDEDVDTIREPPATSWLLREGRAVHGNTDPKICAEEDDCQVQQGESNLQDPPLAELLSTRTPWFTVNQPLQGSIRVVRDFVLRDHPRRLQRNKDLLPPEEDKHQGPVKPKPHTTSSATPSSTSNVSHNGNPRVLILGAEGSGKSTLLKTMKLFCEGIYTRAERNAFKYIIFQNVFQSMRAILEYMDSMGIPLVNSNLLKHETILGQLAVMERGEQSFPVELREVIDSLWRSYWVQSTFRRSGECQLNSSCA